MNEDKFWDSLNNVIKSEKVKGLCSFCKTEIKPVSVIGNLNGRDLSFCPNEKCKQPIVVCLAPGCDNYANGSVIRRPLCSWCFKGFTPNVGSSILRIGTTIAIAAGGFYVKNKLSDK